MPDLDASLGLLGQAAALADRRAGVGGDGVIRVVPAAAAGRRRARPVGRGRWFMDYRNADGSLSEMCGNGTRVFAAYLRREGLETADEFAIATRAGPSTCGPTVTVRRRPRPVAAGDPEAAGVRGSTPWSPDAAGTPARP